MIEAQLDTRQLDQLTHVDAIELARYILRKSNPLFSSVFKIIYPVINHLFIRCFSWFNLRPGYLSYSSCWLS